MQIRQQLSIFIVAAVEVYNSIYIPFEENIRRLLFAIAESLYLI